jgi:hypothetical protein
MMTSFPTDRVPSLQSFPENGFPIAAYFGVPSDIPSLQQGSGSSPSASTTPSSPNNMRLLVILIVFILIAYIGFHLYNR